MKRKLLALLAVLAAAFVITTATGVNPASATQVNISGTLHIQGYQNIDLFNWVTTGSPATFVNNGGAHPNNGGSFVLNGTQPPTHNYSGVSGCIMNIHDVTTGQVFHPTTNSVGNWFSQVGSTDSWWVDTGTNCYPAQQNGRWASGSRDAAISHWHGDFFNNSACGVSPQTSCTGSVLGVAVYISNFYCATDVYPTHDCIGIDAV